MKLLGVVWGEDVGIVNLETEEVVFSAYGKVDGVQWGRQIEAVVDLEDRDFRVPDESTWDEVVEIVKRKLDWKAV